MHEGIPREPDYALMFDIIPRMQDLQEYQPADLLSRENFASLPIKSFRYSVGNPYRQVIYMEWAGEHSHFTWRPMMKTFKDKGGWNILGDAEQRLFMHAFETVLGHKTSSAGKLWTDVHKDPAEELDGQVDMLFKSHEDSPISGDIFQAAAGPYMQITSEHSLAQAMKLHPPR